MIGFQTRHRVSGMRMGFQTKDGFQTWGGVPDMEWGSRDRWGSRHGMMGYQTDDGVPDRGG